MIMIDEEREEDDGNEGDLLNYDLLQSAKWLQAVHVT